MAHQLLSATAIAFSAPIAPSVIQPANWTGPAARGWAFFIIESSGRAEAGRYVGLLLYRQGAPPAE